MIRANKFEELLWMAKEKQPKKIELTDAEVASLRERINNKKITDEDLAVLEQVLLFMLWIQHQLERFKVTAHKLRQIIFGSKTEKGYDSRIKTENPLPDKNVSDQALQEAPPNDEQVIKNIIEPSQPVSEKPKPKGHGRISADDYVPDEIIPVKHLSLKAGDPCPSECGGKLYQPNDDPGSVIRVKGQSCAHVVRYEFDKLRCALCGDTFTAEAPYDFPLQKYDAYFKANLVIQKYFMASPFYRQEQYQKLLGFRLPDSTQWDLTESVADCGYPIVGVLEQMAANATNANHDDTRVKILDVMLANKLAPDKKRKGMFTTCIFAQAGNYKICLYYSGVKHGGENLSALLEKRD